MYVQVHTDITKVATPSECLRTAIRNYHSINRLVIALLSYTYTTAA